MGRSVWARTVSGRTGRLVAVVACTMVSVSGASGLSGQEAEVSSASSQAAEVRAAVNQVFEGMHTADSEMVRAVFASEARFAVIDARNGPASIRSQTVDGWIEAIAGSEGKWDEQVYDLDIQVDGDMASVWAPYTFYLDGAISHCGVNSIELLRDADGWKVTQISDTRKREGCPDPLG